MRRERIAILTYAVAAVLAVAALYWVSRHNYLLFHALVELASVVVAVSLFAIAWNVRDMVDDGYLVCLGCGYLAVAGLDLLHLLAYRGMGVFAVRSADPATQLWIAARYLEAIVLLAAPSCMARRPRPALLLSASLAAGLLLAAAVLVWRVFPACFAEPGGLTVFKKVSELVICVLLAAGVVRLARRRRRLDAGLFRMMTGAVVLTIGAELFFITYVGVFDLANAIGHLLKAVSFLLVYGALVEGGLRDPYGRLFRELTHREADLRAQKERLEQALGRIRTLTGMLPICAGCKKVRNDEGYWQQIEAYVEERSEAEFSHGLCPECARRLYPGFADDEPEAGSPGPRA